METQFVNTYLPSEAMFLEFSRALRSKWKNLLGIAAILLFAFNLVVSLIGGYTAYAVIAAIGIAASGLLLATPLIRAKSLLSNAKDLGGGRLLPTTVRFDDAIHLQEGDFSMDFAYADIADVRQSEHLHIILLSGHESLIVRKDSFTEGTDAAFIPFLQDECRKVAPPEK